MNKKNKGINRRSFLKRLGAGSAVAATYSITGCSNEVQKKYVAEGTGGEVPTDKMEYRMHPSGDKVSLLGYGMMRLPTIADENGNQIINQQRVNELVDYAIAHGVNYFDTAPVYCKGASEKATGIALSRHPRNSYYIATKLSNSRGNHTLQFGIDMFNNSLKELQVDYVDYLLLHNVGSHEAYHRRFIENGLLDYLVEQKKKGRIRNLG
ncbi:MAG: aldo/keto reductase, partial [Bacteroidaceae bacterium]|nr:aldo/keto reductase [Bacteroidaceae bacterium]